MEKLTHLIEDSVRCKEWVPLRLGRKGTMISHLLFADDLLIFCEASVAQMCKVLQILESFGELSGQRLNTQKTSIFFSKNVERSLQNDIINIAGFRREEELGRYLGAFIETGRGSRRKYQFLIDKMQKKLSGWKKQNLSLAGRLTLVQSVTNQMSVYYMQHSNIPVGVRKEMEKIQRDFLWNDKDGKKKLHAISWNTLCMDKAKGGYGLKELDLMNEALLARIGWNMISKPELLVSQVLKGKYERQKDLLEVCEVKNGDSEVWKSLGKLWPKLVRNVRWEVREGTNVRFWLDKWLGDDNILYNAARDTPSYLQIECSVKEMVGEDGNWNIPKLEQWLPKETIDKVITIPPPNDSLGKDVIKWGNSVEGKYNVAAMYKELKHEPDLNEDIWQFIWKWKGTRRMQIHLWMMAHDRLLTAERKSRIMGGSTFCSRCPGMSESLMHVMRDCVFALNIWKLLGMLDENSDFYHLTGKNWILWNLRRKTDDWNLVFGTACWFLWQWRNKILFEPEFSSPDRPDIIIRNYATQMQNRCISVYGQRNSRKIYYVSWESPEDGWIKLNVDGAARGCPGIAGCGGAFRRNDGSWLKGFARKLGICTAIKAELWGIIIGLKMAKDMNLKALVLESDSSTAVSMIQKVLDGGEADSSLLISIKRLLNSFATFKISHIYRECNSVADGLARLSLDQQPYFAEFVFPPEKIKNFVIADSWGVSYPRMLLNDG